jgi:Family of unknown function (DUF5996)
MAQQTTWPALDPEACRDTIATLHLYAQVIGKVQLALSPAQAEWGQAPLRLTARGLTSQLLQTGGRSMTIAFDLTGHELRFDLSDGTQRVLPLESRTVADFYAGVMATLRELGVEVTIDPASVETTTPISLATDAAHSSYERACVASLFQAWTAVAAVFDRFRSGFRGKQSPVDLWWGTFDLSVARFSGRPASPPFDRDAIERVAMDAEQSLVGFWPGDEVTPAPAFFAYTHPKPAGIESATLAPQGALWSPEAGEFVVPYEVVGHAADPARALLDFCESTYAAGAKLAGWDRTLLERHSPMGRVA